MTILFTEPAFFTQAESIAQTNNFTLSAIRPDQTLYLELKESLYLVDGDTNEALTIDFLVGKNRHRRQSGGGELLLKALGVSTGSPVKVLDATAGLGRDAFVIASHGAAVTLLEQSPLLCLLLDRAITTGKAMGSDIEQQVLNRMHLLPSNSVDYLSHHSADVVYLDPMFPVRKKSALVKKDMRILQKLLPHIDDNETQAKVLFDAAFNAAVYRLVVKRPLKAPLLCEKKKPAFQLKGKSVRFDVYTKVALPKTVTTKNKP